MIWVPITDVCGTYQQHEFYALKLNTWYDDIPEQGTLCWVMRQDEVEVALITHIQYTDRSGNFRAGTQYGAEYFSIAVPLTQREVDELFARNARP